jgi:sporulation protein YlmC with PRC-barrel domain
MRLTELLGLSVVDADGARVGRVADVVLVQDGPLRGPYQASLRVTGLIVVERRHIRLMGYERDVRPALVRWLVHRLAGTVRHVRWEDVAGIDADGVRLAVRTAAIAEHDPAARRATA